MIAPPLRTVAIILEPGFASRLVSIAERTTVWIVDSAENRPAIESLWTARRIRGAMYDITVFRAIPGLTPEEHVAGVLRSVAKDVAADESLPSIDSIEVYGVDASDAMRSTFAEHGYPRLDPVDDGFRARRAMTG